MREQTVGEYLDHLAAREPAPGGGAAAALAAAQGAALLAMVARYSDTAKYAEHAEVIGGVLAEADALRDRALQLAADDAEAFGAVGAAYGLPKDTDDAKATRSAAIASALVGAAAPPAAVIEVGTRLVELAETLLPVGNRNVVTDVAAAADAARAAVTTARVNVEINLGGIKDADAAARLRAALAGVDDVAARADAVTSAVRATIAPAS
ncbi:cyclodeaminase/cyclohydrolase family protein [Jatrophihabitans sp. YIM 134969]